MAHIDEMTLSKLILDKTGMKLNHFARIYGFSEHNLKAWSAPKTSPVSRVPNARNLLKLAGILGTPEQIVYDLCTRPNDVKWEF
jgi:DNA-binding transcriptional regulator YiaG